MGRQQREKRKKSKASKKNVKAKDEEIPSTPSGEASSNEPSLSANPAWNFSVDVEDNVTSVITAPTTGIQEDMSPAKTSRRKTRTCKGDLSSNESIPSGDPAQTSGVDLEGSTTSPVISARIQEDGASPNRATRSVKQSSKGEMPSDDPMLTDDLVPNSGVEGECKANSPVQTSPTAVRIQDDIGSPVRMTRRMTRTRSCKVTARINENSNERDGKASEASSKAEEALAASLQQQLEATVHALQEASPTRVSLKTQGNKASPAAMSGTVCVESLGHSPSSFDLSKISPHSSTASPVVCLERCIESDMLARQGVQSSYEESPSSEAVRVTVKNQRRNPKISEHLGKKNGCRRKISPSSTAFKIHSLGDGSCTEGVSKSVSLCSAADVVMTGESASLRTENEPSPSQLGTPALPSAMSKRFVGRGVKRSFPGSDSDQVPRRKLLKLDSCDLGNEEGIESQSVMNCGNTNDILSHKSDTKLHEQENCCRCADANDANNEFSGNSRQCNCRVQSSFSYNSENETRNEAFLDLEYQPADSRASVRESACGRSGSCYTQSVDQCGSDINSSSFEYKDDVHLDDPRDLSLKGSLVPGVVKGVPDDCGVNTSRRNGSGQEDICQDDSKNDSRDLSLKCSSVCGNTEDICSTVNISTRYDYSHQDDPKDSSVTCTLVPGGMEGVPDDRSNVNTSRRDDISQEEFCHNDQEDPGCFRSNQSRSSVNVPLGPLVQHREGSRLLGGGSTTKSSRKKSKSFRRSQDNSENSDSDGSSSRTSSRNLVDHCATDGHQEDQDSENLQDLNGGNTGEDCERSSSASPQNYDHCSRTLPVSKAFPNWKLHQSARSDAKLDLGGQTDENFSKYNASCREKQDTLTDMSASELSSLIRSESLSSQGSKVHSPPSKHKKSYFEGCERGLSCSASPKSANSYNCFADEREELEGISEDHVGTERISWKTNDRGSKFGLNRHARSEIHSSLRHEGNSDGISVEDDHISNVNSRRSISLDCSVDKVQSQVSKYEEKQIEMNSKNHKNEKVSQKINRNDLVLKGNIPSTEHGNCYKNKMSAKRDHRKSKLNSKPNSETHSRSHEPSLKLSNGFDLALEESSKYSHGGKINSHERKNKKPSLGDNHKRDSEPVENEKSVSSHPHSRSSSERKSGDVGNNKHIRENVKDRNISKKKKLSLKSKECGQFESYEGRSSVPNEVDKGVCESYKVSAYVERLKMVDSSHSGSRKMAYDMIRNLGSEKRCSNVTKVIGSSEVGEKEERNKCKITGKNDSGIYTIKRSVSHNVEDTVMNKSDEQPAFTDEQAAEDDKQERADISVNNTTTAGEIQLLNIMARSGIVGEDNLELLIRGLWNQYGPKKFMSVVTSLGGNSCTQSATEGKEAVPCPEEREQFNECSPRELGRTHVRNLNNAFQETDIRPSSVVVPGTKDSDQEDESSEIITDNKQQSINGEVEDTGFSKQRNLGLSESCSNLRNFVRNQEAESQCDTLSNSIKPLKAVGNCYKEMGDSRKLNSTTSILKIRSKPISCELLSIDRSTKQPRANVKRSGCNVNVASSKPACIVKGESAGDSGPLEELSPTNRKLQGSPKMRTRSQKAPTPKCVNDGYENVLTALHLVKSPCSTDGDRSVSGLQVIETPAHSSSENSGSNGNKVLLSENKEKKNVPEASKVVQKPSSPVRKRLKRNWIVKTTETPPVSKITLVTPSTPPACTTPVPSSCSSLESSPSREDVLSSPTPNVTASINENTSQNKTFPLAPTDTSRKSVLSSTLNLPSSESVKTVPSVFERKGVCEESPFKIPFPDKSKKNVPVSSKTQEASPARTKPSSPVKTQPRVLNIPKINRQPNSLSSTSNPVNRPLHPRITAPPQTNEEDCDDDDDAISLFAESTDLDIEDILNSSLSNIAKRPTTTTSNLNSSCAPRHNFVRRQAIEMPPAEPEPEPEPEPEDVQMEMQETEENNQEEEEQDKMEVDTNMVDDCDALDGIEDDRESVLAELQSRHSIRSVMDYLICNNSEEVKLCVDAVNLNPFSSAGQDSRVSAVAPAQATRVSPGGVAPPTRVPAITAAQATRLSPGRMAPPMRISAATPAQATRVSPGGVAPPTRVSTVKAAQATRMSPGIGAPPARVSTVTASQATSVSAEITRPSPLKHFHTSRPSPVTPVQASRSSPVQTSAAFSAQSNSLDPASELMDYHVPKCLKSHEKQRFYRMCFKHCYGFLKNGSCFKKNCLYRHQVPTLEKNNDILKVVKWCADRGFTYMSSMYTQLFIQYVCDTSCLRGVFLWNGIFGCLIHAGRSVEDSVNSVLTYVFQNDRTEYFAPVLEMLVKHKLLLSCRNILLKGDGIQGFEFPVSVVKYLLSEPETKQDLYDITLKFIRCESLHRGLWRVERSLINRYVCRLNSAGLTNLISKFEQVARMPVHDYNKSRTVLNGGDGLLPIPNKFRSCAEEMFKVPSMSAKESLTQAKCNMRNNSLLSRKFSSEKQQLMESSDLRTPIRETSRSMNSKKFGGVMASEFNVSSHNFVPEPEAVEHGLPHNGLVTQLASPRNLLEDQSCNFSSYPRNMSQMAKGQEVHDHNASSNSSNKVMLLDRAGNDKLFRVSTLGTPMEQETQLCLSPFSTAFSGSSSSQPHFSLSSLSQEGQGSPFSSRRSAASESNSSKSMTGQPSPVRLPRDDRRKMEDSEPSKVDLQERLSVKSRLGVPNSSPVLEESRWDPGSVWEVSPMVVERDVRTRLISRLRDSDISRLPDWKLPNMEQDLAPPGGRCSPAAVDESLISLRKVLLSGEMSSALNILRKFCAHDMKYSFAREAVLSLKNNVQLSSVMFGRLMLQSEREQKSVPLFHLLCTIGVNLMFDVMDQGLVNEAHVIYTLLKDRDIHIASAQIFQEQMTPCRITLKCCQICINAKNYHEAKNLLLQNDLQYGRPEKWKVEGIPEDLQFRVEVVNDLLAALANDGPSVAAFEFLIAIVLAQSRKYAPVDVRTYSNTVMLRLLKDGRKAEVIDLFLVIEAERNSLEAATYRWLLITLEQANRTALTHRLYGVAVRMSVYPYINWKSRPLHVKIYSYWLHEEILVVMRDFLHQLKQGDELKPTEDPAKLNLCLYIENKMKPKQLKQKSYPLILSQVKDSIDDVKQRLFGVLRLFQLKAISAPQDRTVQIDPESLAKFLKAPEL